MAVVICPGAVRAQIDEKDRQLDALGKAVGEAYNKIDGFCNAGAQNKEMWSGEAFQAACAHMELYRNFCKALGECVEKTKAADQKVKDALGSRFGDASYISEQEWLNRQAYAQDRVNSLRQQAAEAEQEGDSWGFGAGFVAAVLRFSADGWQRSANCAEEMLSKIRSYCEETDYLHEGLSGWLHETRVDAATISNCSVSFNRGSLWREDLGSFLWRNTEGASLIERNERLLLFKGYGNGFDAVLLFDPVVRPIADWLAENENYAKIGFGLVDVAVGIFTSNIPVAIVGTVSILEGAYGLVSGETVDWGANAFRTAATIFGGDPDKAELTYLTVTGGISTRSVGKAAKVVRVEEDVSGLSRTTKTSKALGGGMRDMELEGSVPNSMFSIESQVKDFEVFAGALDRIEDAVDVIGKMQDISRFIDGKREDGYAETSFTAVGYSY